MVLGSMLPEGAKGKNRRHFAPSARRITVRVASALPDHTATKTKRAVAASISGWKTAPLASTTKKRGLTPSRMMV